MPNIVASHNTAHRLTNQRVFRFKLCFAMINSDCVIRARRRLTTKLSDRRRKRPVGCNSR